MICRVWHGWTNRANADAYENLLREQIFRKIANREIPGFLGIEKIPRSVAPGT